MGALFEKVPDGVSLTTVADVAQVVTSLLTAGRLTQARLLKLPYFRTLGANATDRLDEALSAGVRFYILLRTEGSSPKSHSYTTMPHGEVSKWPVIRRLVNRGGRGDPYSVDVPRETPRGYEGWKTIHDVMKANNISESTLIHRINSGTITPPDVRSGCHLLWRPEVKKVRTVSLPAKKRVITLSPVQPDQMNKEWLFGELKSLLSGCVSGLTSVDRDRLSVLEVMARVV